MVEVEIHFRTDAGLAKTKKQYLHGLDQLTERDHPFVHFLLLKCSKGLAFKIFRSFALFESSIIVDRKTLSVAGIEPTLLKFAIETEPFTTWLPSNP